MSESKEAADNARQPRWKRFAREALIVLVLFVAIRAWQTRDLPSGPAPELHATTLSGAEVDAVSAEQPTLVHFWATWCGVCKAMDHNIVALAEDRRVITVATQSRGPREIEAWLREEGLWGKFEVVPDPSGQLAASWSVGSFPTSFVIDEDGNIDHSEVGYSTELGLRARLWLAQ